MIKKIIILSDFIDGIPKFIKAGSNLRLTYMLRKKGYDVLPLHHCMSFNEKELSKILDSFANNEKIVVCMSTSFILSRSLHITLRSKINSRFIKSTLSSALRVGFESNSSCKSSSLSPKCSSTG